MLFVQLFAVPSVHSVIMFFLLQVKSGISFPKMSISVFLEGEYFTVTIEKYKLDHLINQ